MDSFRTVVLYRIAAGYYLCIYWMTLNNTTKKRGSAMLLINSGFIIGSFSVSHMLNGVRARCKSMLGRIHSDDSIGSCAKPECGGKVYEVGSGYSRCERCRLVS